MAGHSSPAESLEAIRPTTVCASPAPRNGMANMARQPALIDEEPWPAGAWLGLTDTRAADSNAGLGGTFQSGAGAPARTCLRADRRSGRAVAPRPRSHQSR
jgi:hypothetical protein